MQANQEPTCELLINRRLISVRPTVLLFLDINEHQPTYRFVADVRNFCSKKKCAETVDDDLNVKEWLIASIKFKRLKMGKKDTTKFLLFIAMFRRIDFV